MQVHCDDEYYLCDINELPEQGAKGFELDRSGRRREIFVVRQWDKVYGYVNSCPHTRGPLEWLPDQFLDLDKAHIQCSTHDARFRIEDGYCISGPCAGQSLKPVRLMTKGEGVYLCREDMPV